MSKHKGHQSPPSGKMTVMLIQLEGDDATLQEGIRTFKEAMSRAMPSTPRRFLPIAPAPMAAIADQVEIADDSEIENDSISEEVAVAERNPNPSQNKAASTRSFPRMQFVKDLDLRPDGKQHLKDLLEVKQPKDQNERITICVYYLRRVLEIENVTANHIYTCMDDVKIRHPNDLPQTIRNIAARKGWIDCTNSSAIEITTKGANLVQHDLPRNGS